jgi:hypothetical protein
VSRPRPATIHLDDRSLRFSAAQVAALLGATNNRRGPDHGQISVVTSFETARALVDRGLVQARGGGHFLTQLGWTARTKLQPMHPGR